MRYKYIFGPVNSRRFGLSLGVDLSPETKSCNFDCLYCELSIAKLKEKIDNEADPKEIVSELKEALEEFKDIDVITVTANGEPTLYSQLEELIVQIEKIKGNKKTLILSNGSTIYKKEIMDALRNFDIVKLSLDSAKIKTFKKLDRNLDSIDLNDIIEGMIKFRSVYMGVFVVEILVVKGLNDTFEEMRALDEVLKNIKPDRVDLSTIDRPPAYGVEGISEERLKELADIFKDISVNIVYKKEPKERVEYSKDELLHTITLRSLSQFDIESLLSTRSKEFLKELIEEGEVIEDDIGGVKFYRSSKRVSKRRA